MAVKIRGIHFYIMCTYRGEEKKKKWQRTDLLVANRRQDQWELTSGVALGFSESSCVRCAPLGSPLQKMLSPTRPDEAHTGEASPRMERVTWTVPYTGAFAVQQSLFPDKGEGGERGTLRDREATYTQPVQLMLLTVNSSRSCLQHLLLFISLFPLLLFLLFFLFIPIWTNFFALMYFPVFLLLLFTTFPVFSFLFLFYFTYFPHLHFFTFLFLVISLSVISLYFPLCISLVFPILLLFYFPTLPSFSPFFISHFSLFIFLIWILFYLPFLYFPFLLLCLIFPLLLICIISHILLSFFINLIFSFLLSLLFPIFIFPLSLFSLLF